MKRPYDIYGFGSALLDVVFNVSDDVLKVARLPKGQMTLVDEDHAQHILVTLAKDPELRSSGGSTANAIAMASLLGSATCFSAVVGRDIDGEYYKEHMEADDVATYLSYDENIKTGYAITLVTPDHERTFATFLGAAEVLSPKHINDVCIQESVILHTEGYLIGEGSVLHDAIVFGLEQARRCSTMISLDLSDAGIISRSRDQFVDIIRSSVDILFANEDEARALVGKEGEDALRAIAELGVKKIFLKQGAKGALAYIDGKIYTFESYRVNAIDTTGAGDVFAGVVLHGISHDVSIEEIGKQACFLSSKIVEKVGARFSRNEVLLNLELFENLK